MLFLFIGCSSQADGEQADADVERGQGQSSPTEDQESDGEPDWSGAPLNPFDLRLGHCFNEVSWIDQEAERRINITAEVACTEAHDSEVYFEAEFPAPAGAPYPGEGAMTSWTTERCYEEFESFVGQEYELSKYGIDFLHPTLETFEHPVGRHRRVTCFLYSTEDEQLVGSARNTAT